MSVIPTLPALPLISEDTPSAMFWFRLFLPFAGAYFLSYHFRTINAVVGPILSNEMALGAADLGLLTSTYFFAFGLAQIPVGIALDRYGPRRVEGVLLLMTALGAALFAYDRYQRAHKD